MSTEDTQTLPAPEIETPRKRRWPWVVAIVAGILVWILVVLAVFVIRYKPLSSDSFAPLPPENLDQTRQSSNVFAPIYEDGKTTGYVFQLRNDGRFGIRITEIKDLHGPNDLLQPVDIRLSTGLGFCCTVRDSQLAPFRPFTLGSAGFKVIVVRERFANCAKVPAGTIQTFGLPRLAFTIVGVTRHQEIGPWKITTKSPPDPGCPGRSP